MFLNQTTATTWPWQPPISLSARATLIPRRRARILSKKMKSQRSAWKFSWKEWRPHQKNAPPPTQNLVCCLWHKDSGQPQIICHSLIYKLPSGRISSHFLPIAKSRYCIRQTHIGRDSCITSLGMRIVWRPSEPFVSTTPMPPRAVFLEVEHVQSQLSRKALEHHQWVSCETSHVYETDLDCRWLFLWHNKTATAENKTHKKMNKEKHKALMTKHMKKHTKRHFLVFKREPLQVNLFGEIQQNNTKTLGSSSLERSNLQGGIRLGVGAVSGGSENPKHKRKAKNA